MIQPLTDKTLAEFGLGDFASFSKEESSRSTTDRPNMGYSTNDATTDTQSDSAKSSYAGDIEDNEGPFDKSTGYRTLDFSSPAQMLAVVRKDIATEKVVLYDWQLDISDELAQSMQTATSLHPYKYALCAANGSGKDAFVVAPFVVWFMLVNVRGLVIVTSSSGQQLSAQTENYIKALAEEVNAYFGATIFRIRQRFIKCYLTGSEVRLFATDEAGKAEGYHPMEPNAKMAIIVNECKSVAEDIFEALRRCTGYTHWLNVSTPGAPKGSFYRAFNNWTHTRRVDYTDCPRHMSEDERLEDLRDYGLNSAYYRSKWLALFTSLEGLFIIPRELIDSLLLAPPEVIGSNWKLRIGIDLAAGSDETVVSVTRGNKLVKELYFKEKDTTRAADRINSFLLSLGIEMTHEHIYGDDGGVGHSIIDMLCRMGWSVKRILNQSRAVVSSQYGNRGAELWDRAKRLFEERLFDPTGMSEKTIEQLTSRKYKEITKGKTFLESKKEAKAEGIHSPDRADAFILSLTGLNVEDFLKAIQPTKDERPKIKLTSADQVYEYYTNNVTYQNANKRANSGPTESRTYGSLKVSINRNNKREYSFRPN